MKKNIIFLVFVVLVYLCLKIPSLALQPPTEEPHCVCCPPFKLLGTDCLPPSFLLEEQIEEALAGLSRASNELVQASKFARPILSRIDFLIKKIRQALNLNSQANRCKKTISASIDRLDSLIKKLGGKSCSIYVKSSCIPDEIINEFLPLLEESTEDLRSTFQIDDDENGIPDICD